MIRYFPCKSDKPIFFFILFDVVECLTYQTTTLTAFTDLSDNYDKYKNNKNSSISTIILNLDSSDTSLSILIRFLDNNFVKNTT